MLTAPFFFDCLDGLTKVLDSYIKQVFMEETMGIIYAFITVEDVVIGYVTFEVNRST